MKEMKPAIHNSSFAPSRLRAIKPYPAYKDSGVPWLGEVPEHWEVRRLKHAARLIMGQSPSSEDCSTEPIGLPFLQGCAEFGPNNPHPKQFCRAPAKVCPKEAILISVRAPVGRLNLADQDYGIGRGLCGIIPNPHLLNRTYSYYVLSASIHSLNVVSTGSTYDAVSVGDIGAHVMLLPPLPEQTAIVCFLDYMDRRIRRYIRAKQKLIKLLEEYRKALIHQAVTGRIDVRTGQPYPAYKDSGVEWLGEVPAHWEVRRTKTLFQSRKQLNTDGSETNVLSLTLRGVVNNDPDNPEGLVPKDYKTYQIFEKDDLVFKLIDLENVRTSRVGLVHERGIMSPAYVRLTLSGMGNVRFYYQQFYDLYQRSIYNQIGEGVRSTIGWSDLAKLCILAPPLPEQTAIVEYLDAQTAKIDAAIDATRRETELLREYRTRLIADVVTGKVDVREVAAQLPEEPPEEEAQEPELLAEPDEEADGEEREESGPDKITAEELEEVADA